MRTQQWEVALASGMRTRALPILLALLVLVPAFLAADLAHSRSGVALFTDDVRWDVDRDVSYIEVYGYLQLVVASLLLLVLAYRRRPAPLFLAWALTLATVILDDSLQWHERFGGWLARNADVPVALGLRAQDMGELLLWAMLGLGLLLVLALAYRQSSRAVQRDGWGLAAGLAVLIAFAIGVDMAHSMIADSVGQQVGALLSWVEAAGEVAAMSGLVAYCVHLLRDDRSTRPWTLDRTSEDRVAVVTAGLPEHRRAG